MGLLYLFEHEMNTRKKIYARNRLATLRLVLVQYGSDKTLMETKPCEKQILQLLRYSFARTRNRLATLRLVLVMSVDDSTRRETIKLLADR